MAGAKEIGSKSRGEFLWDEMRLQLPGERVGRVGSDIAMVFIPRILQLRKFMLFLG